VTTLPFTWAATVRAAERPRGPCRISAAAVTLRGERVVGDGGDLERALLELAATVDARPDRVVAL
jgi:hypothetical protein